MKSNIRFEIRASVAFTEKKVNGKTNGNPDNVSADYLDVVSNRIEHLNDHLKGFDLPPIDKWEENPDVPGEYCTTVTTDDDLNVDNDGEYETEFIINVVTYTITPYSKPKS